MLSTAPARSTPRHDRGFTLVEVVVVITLAAVLATLSYPGLAGVVRRVHRTDALTALATVQLLQQRYRSMHPRFASLDQLGIAAAVAGGRYALEVSAPTAAGYVLIASAHGAQAGDSACRQLRIEVIGADTHRSSGPAADIRNDAPQNRRCWGE